MPTLPLTASRALDALVAERVMGVHVWTEKEIHTACDWLVKGQVVIDVRRSGEHTTVIPCPSYSTSIAAAWTVVEKLVANDKFVLSLENHRYDTLASAEWMVRWMWTDKDHGQWNEVEADTAPLAICLAALKAVE